MKRKAISKKDRFDIFKRDSFCCQYCGATPPNTVLELDHIHPISKGGDNDINNLVTSCFDCNRGKSDRLLSSIPRSLSENTIIALEKEEQLAALKKMKTAVKRRITRDVNSIEKAFQETFEDYSFGNKFKDTVKLRFLTKLDVSDLVDHIKIACNKIDDDPDRAIKYFCGINWSVIKELSNEH